MATKSKSKGPAVPLTPDEALTRLRALCFGFPAVEEKASHGSPSFFVRGKQFASFTMGYGRGPSAWVKCDLESQAQLVAEEPERYFVPPYVGSKGWVGMRLDRDPDWTEVANVVARSYRLVAPRRIGVQLGDGRAN
ncbi:MAG TPA: MmcQ/YjbR family DNA-binding protein [Myxococcota bacterium]|nr:MmcQ/YjbR family DNA-binding protein [Myxococcota bacterium]